MKILFPCDIENVKLVEPDFETEFEAARSVGFDTLLYNHDELIQGNDRGALRGMPKGNGESVLLRGWMVNGETHSILVKCLLGRGYNPVTEESHYERAHYIPAWYHTVSKYTARTAWVHGDIVEDAWKLYQPFSFEDAVIKDYVKSAKYRWEDGCFIPAGTTEERFREIFSVFREERGNLFNRGVVIREFVPFIERGGKIASLPVIKERRMFFWNGELLAAGEEAPTEDPTWEMLAKKFKCPFITIDVAQRNDGEWRVIECGDGGVSGLPLDIEPLRFYSVLHNMTS